MSEGKIPRWGTAERLEHFTIMVLIPTFIVSGLPLFIREWFGWMLVPPLTVDLFRDVHKVAAGLYTVVAIFHVFYHTIGLRRGTRVFMARRDFKDTITTIKYYFGFTKEMPKIGFHYPSEKLFSYWLMAVWFMIFMGISGIILLYSWYFPLWIRQWALIIHDVFFILITLILIFHFYMSVIYTRHRALLDGMFRDGMISAEYAKTYHPLWYEEIKKKKE
ncbi:MAG: cytochrome b/b6 domain-containing protein [archaeon]|nr:cytochrome b/b6 domain-containing protein [archaeon]